MREALAIISAEGLPSLWERHHKLHLVLLEGLSALGLKPFVESDADRLVSVNTIKVNAPGVTFCVLLPLCCSCCHPDFVQVIFPANKDGLMSI